MLLHRSLHPLSKSTHLRRPFSGAAFAVIHQNGNPSTHPPPSPQPPLTYLDGFPRPDPKFAETILAIPRASSGKYVAAKERKAGRVPGIVFEQEDGQHGGNKRLISVRTNQIRKLVNQLGSSFFLSRLFDLEVRTDFDSEAETDLVEKVRVLPRLLHLNSATDKPINVTFIRAPSHALLKVDVPLVYRGEDVSPGLRKGRDSFFGVYLYQIVLGRSLGSVFGPASRLRARIRNFLISQQNVGRVDRDWICTKVGFVGLRGL